MERIFGKEILFLFFFSFPFISTIKMDGECPIVPLFPSTSPHNPLKLSGKEVSASFQSEPPFSLLSVSRKNKKIIDLDGLSLLSLWSVDLVVEGQEGTISISATTPTERFAYSQCANNLNFFWFGMEVLNSSVTVILTISVDQNDLFTHSLSLSPSSSNIGIWSFEFQIKSPTTHLHTLIQNSGFGVLHSCSSSSTCHHGFAEDYPQSTFQFLASYIENEPDSGFYFGTHDPNAYSKTFQFQGIKEKNGGVMSVSGQPPNAGLSFSSFDTSFDAVWTVFDGDWWDASMIYRDWALTEATWVSQGLIKDRADLPQWARDLTVWVNSHWQQVDIFNTTGGDAQVLYNRMANIVQRFGNPPEGVGLHWYEWDTLGYAQGSNYTKCDAYEYFPDQFTCGFDTHYPEYDIVRDGFGGGVMNLQELGVRVVPYMNARIFDTSTTTWREEDGASIASKSSNPTFNPSPSFYSTYNESYGSHANFAVSCPATSYWQNKISSAVGDVVKYGVDGIYLDQIAAAGPRNCFDSSHGHEIGGGDYWVSGYRSLLQQTRSSLTDSRILLTESNAEPFMDGINVYLTLVGFSGNFEGVDRIAPIFPAVYGGYYISMGAEFFKEDLTNNPDVFSAKIAEQFGFGAQLGWFSLGGRNNQNPYMGLYETLLDDEYNSEIDYLMLLMDGKRKLGGWLQDGRAMRDIDVVTNLTEGERVVVAEYSGRDLDVKLGRDYLVGADQLVYNPLSQSTWQLQDLSDLLITFTTVARSLTISVEFEIDVQNYGMVLRSPNQTCSLTQIYPPPSVAISQSPCTNVQWKSILSPHSLVGLSVTMDN